LTEIKKSTRLMEPVIAKLHTLAMKKPIGGVDGDPLDQSSNPQLEG
jgi:hypothetical protein